MKAGRRERRVALDGPQNHRAEEKIKEGFISRGVEFCCVMVFQCGNGCMYYLLVVSTFQTSLEIGRAHV